MVTSMITWLIINKHTHAKMIESALEHKCHQVTLMVKVFIINKYTHINKRTWTEVLLDDANDKVVDHWCNLA